MTLRVSPDEIVANSASPLLKISSDWKRVRLGDVAEITNGAAYKSAQFNNDRRGMPLIRIRDVGKPQASTYFDGEYEDRHVVAHGDLLVGMDGDFRAARWEGPESLLNQRVCRLRVVADDLYSSAFLAHVLQPYLDEIHRVTSAVTVKHLSSRTLHALPIPMPPRSEQDRIVEALDEHLSRLSAASEAVASASRRLEAFQRSVIAAVFDRPDWPWTTLGEIAEVKGGVTKDSKRQDDPEFVEVPYLRVANVQRGFLDLSEVTTLRVAPKKAEQLRLVPGDILFNEGGDRDKLGRGWVWEGAIDRCIHQNHVFRARLTTDRFDPYFISMHGNTWGQQWFERNGKQTTNLASINLSTLKAFPIPAPPLIDQREVMTELEVLLAGHERLRLEVDRAGAHVEVLRRAILAAAFSGRLASSDSVAVVAIEPRPEASVHD